MITVTFKSLHEAGRGRRHAPGIRRTPGCTIPGCHTYGSRAAAKVTRRGFDPQKVFGIYFHATCSFCSDNHCHLPSQEEMSEGFLGAYGINLFSRCGHSLQKKRTKQHKDPLLSIPLRWTAITCPTEPRTCRPSLQGAGSGAASSSISSPSLGDRSEDFAEFLGKYNSSSHIFLSRHYLAS